MRRTSLPLVLLLAACSSHPGTAGLGTPTPVLPTSASPAAASSQPQPSRTPGTPLSPASRRTGGATATSAAAPSPSRSRTTSSPAARTPSPTPTATRAGKTYAVNEVTGYRFSPMALTLRVGDSVLVTDQDSVYSHTFTIGALKADSGDMSRGDTYRFRFTRAGTFDFVCTYHQSLGMTGTVTVKP